ncbi:MAG TPA: NUDIX domain-containing protein [Stellaceae bacterium]|nr:NUDIX domain-containing protein [Stellaceae bacterium]
MRLGRLQNPEIVVGAVCRWDARILLCRRAINPRAGYWTLPAGYLGLNESTPAGAMREAWEEAEAPIAIDELLAVYDIPRISQGQLIDRAFPSVRWALDHCRDCLESGDCTIRRNRV